MEILRKYDNELLSSVKTLVCLNCFIDCQVSEDLCLRKLFHGLQPLTYRLT